MMFFRGLRQNPHILNYAVITAASIIPVLLYANSRSPSQESIETALNDNYEDHLRKAKQNTENINNFWKYKRNNTEMDAIYGQLLRSGKSSMKRHESLQGTLAEETKNQNPEYARTEKILTVIVPPVSSSSTTSSPVPPSSSTTSTVSSSAVPVSNEPKVKKKSKSSSVMQKTKEEEDVASST